MHSFRRIARWSFSVQLSSDKFCVAFAAPPPPAPSGGGGGMLSGLGGMVAQGMQHTCLLQLIIPTHAPVPLKSCICIHAKPSVCPAM